jgi:hypothetical protein
MLCFHCSDLSIFIFLVLYTFDECVHVSGETSFLSANELQQILLQRFVMVDLYFIIFEL